MVVVTDDLYKGVKNGKEWKEVPGSKEKGRRV